MKKQKTKTKQYPQVTALWALHILYRYVILLQKKKCGM